ncbi:MAG: WXG100 family type VII secretion target [Nigerium sp.]|nr:WXG100 family type VII secretion target [Nigerium sp.]
MANLNVSYDAMDSEATALMSGRQQIEGDLTALANRINGLVSNGFVTDSASGAFQQMYEEFTTSAKNTIASLDQIANTLKQMAQTMQDTDQAMARSIG